MTQTIKRSKYYAFDCERTGKKERQKRLPIEYLCEL